MSEFCFTSLSAQSWHYRDRRKPEAGTTLISNSRVLQSAQYYSHKIGMWIYVLVFEKKE